MADAVQAIREALALMPKVAWGKHRHHVEIPEAEDWCAVDIQCRANRLVGQVVARYIKACEPFAILELLARLDAAEADQRRYRWLRDIMRYSDGVDGAIYVRQVGYTQGTMTSSAILVEEDLDKAVDESRAQDSAKEQTA